MARREVDLHPEAIAEARAARAWYAERSTNAAAEFMGELDAAIERIATVPLSCPVYLHKTRRYLFKRFPFLAVFRVRSDDCQVIAVAHGRRKPGYWKHRK